MTAQYAILFLIELNHEFYTSRLLKDLDILPSAATRQLIKDKGCILKIGEGYAAVLSPIDANHKPIKEWSGKEEFIFYLKYKSHLFPLLTNLNVNPKTKLYFTNAVDNFVSGKPYLHAPVPAYQNSEEYAIGDLVGNGSGDYFEAIQNNGSGNVHGLNDSDFWMSKGRTPFVTATNVHATCDELFTTAVNAGQNFGVEIFRFNVDSQAYDESVTEFYQLHFEHSTDNVQIRMDHLDDGFYRVKINSEDFEVFKDAVAHAPDVMGIVCLQTRDNVPLNSRIFSNDGSLKEINYHIHFANRAVLWKYNTRTSDVDQIEDTANQIQFTSPVAKTFVSTKPIPLTQAPITTLQFHSLIYGDIKYLANPPTNALKTLEQNAQSYFCLESYIKY